jgi:hypothetical protein
VLRAEVTSYFRVNTLFGGNLLASPACCESFRMDPATVADRGGGRGTEGGLAPPNKLPVYLVFISSCLLISHYLLISIH